MTTGDHSRFTFEPRRNVRTVMVLQGRPLTDADLNEAGEATLRRIETEAVDLVGAAGSPLHGGGFRIVRSAADLTPEEAADPRNARGPSAVVQNAPFLITAGRFYAGGLQVENHGLCGPLALSAAGASMVPSQPMPLPSGSLAGDGNRLVYLRAVVDQLTPIEAPYLLDPALGDADTSNRAVVSWQVGVLDAGIAALCGDPVSAWADTVAPSTGRMIVSLNAATPSTDPCKLTPGAGYVRPENLLYRVQVHDGVVVETCADGPRFGRDGLVVKVSRNNAMEVARITDVSGAVLTVAPGSRDGLPTFGIGGWIEILADGAEARGDAAIGWTQVIGVAGDKLTVASAAGAVAGQRIRLWSFDLQTVPVVPTEPLPIEDGLEVIVPAGGEFRRGDYILIPARYAVGDEYWLALTGRELAPFGPRVEYARLAMLTVVAGVVQTVTDCRPTFEPLTELLSFHYAGGDGQTVSPVGVAAGGLAEAGAQLKAGVRLGRKPAVGSLVRFELIAPSGGATAGQLDRTGSGPGPAKGSTVIAATGADGLAAVSWSLALAPSRQQVRAVLLDAADPSNSAVLPLTVEYTAELDLAAGVGYAAGACAGLAGIDNVQEALDKLCVDLGNVAAPPPPEFLVVEQMVTINNGQPFFNNSGYGANDFSDGITVIFSEEIGTKTEGFEPIFQFWIDLPHPVDPTERALWAQWMGLPGKISSIFGTIPMTLSGRTSIDGQELTWTPTDQAQRFLQTSGKHFFGIQAPPNGPKLDYDDVRIKAHITIRGDAIWSANPDPLKYLNGEALLFNDGNNLFNMDQPKEYDLQRAADYRMWFYLDK